MKVLVVDAHPDDGEISCAGTISRMRREGHEVYTMYFCPCSEDPKNEGHLKDHNRVCRFLDIKQYVCGEMPRDGYVETHKQQVRDILYQIRERLKPDIILCPSIHEFHQDHKALAECCLTIFRDTSIILGYEILRSVSPDFTPNFYVTLSTGDRNKKLKSISMYKSQLNARPYFFSIDRFDSQLRMRGTQAMSDFAEAYEMMWGRV